MTERIEIIQWLQVRLPLYASQQQTLEKLKGEATVLGEKDAYIRDNLTRLTVVVEQARKLLPVSNENTEKADSWLSHTLSEVHKWQLDPMVHQAFVQHVTALHRYTCDSIVASQNLSNGKARLKSIQDDVNQLEGLNQKHQKFLRDVQTFVTALGSVNACPACGTPGKTAMDILAFVAEQRQLMNPQLQAKEIDLARVQGEVDTLNAKFTIALESLREASTRFEEQVQSLVDQLHTLGKERIEVQAAIMNNTQAQEGFKKLVLEFEEKCQLIGLVELPMTAGQLDNLMTIDKTTALQITQTLRDAGYGTRRQLEEDLQQDDEVRRDLEARVRDIVPNANFGLVDAILTDLQVRLKVLTEQSDNLDRADRASLNVQALLEQADLYHAYRKAKGDAAKAMQELAQTEKELATLNAHMGAVQNVIDKVPEAIDRLNTRLMDELRIAVEDIYHRIGTHPVYSEVSYQTGQAYRANRLYITAGTKDEGVRDINPSFIFSTAQINAVALSFFLAMALSQQWSTLTTIAMDDPVQSMDDLNVVQLVDLIRALANMTTGAKQFIISTHDSMLFQLMLRKFRNLSLSVIEFSNYTKDGPSVQEHFIPNLVGATLSSSEYPDPIRDLQELIVKL